MAGGSKQGKNKKTETRKTTQCLQSKNMIWTVTKNEWVSDSHLSCGASPLWRCWPRSCWVRGVWDVGQGGREVGGGGRWVSGQADVQYHRARLTWDHANKPRLTTIKYNTGSTTDKGVLHFCCSFLANSVYVQNKNNANIRPPFFIVSFQCSTD